MVDDTIKINVEHHHKLGLKPVVKRVSSGKCCKWYDKIAGGNIIIQMYQKTFIEDPIVVIALLNIFREMEKNKMYGQENGQIVKIMLK